MKMTAAFVTVFVLGLGNGVLLHVSLSRPTQAAPEPEPEPVEEEERTMTLPPRMADLPPDYWCYCYSSKEDRDSTKEALRNPNPTP
jgi:hypothetical protein